MEGLGDILQNIFFEVIMIIEEMIVLGANEISAIGSVAQALVSLVAVLAAWNIGKNQNKISERQLTIMENQNKFERMKFTHENIYKELHFSIEQLLDGAINMRGFLDRFDENTSSLFIYQDYNKVWKLYLDFINIYNDAKDFSEFDKDIDKYVLDISKAIFEFFLLKTKIPSMKNSTNAESTEWEQDFNDKQEQIALLKKECSKTFNKVFPK